MTAPDPLVMTLAGLSALSLALAALGFANARRLSRRVAALEARYNAPPVEPKMPAVSLVPDRRADPPIAPVVSGPILIAVPDLAANSAGTPSRPETSHRHEAVWEMADAGASAGAIALALGQPIGQVELILGLKRRSPTTSTRGPRRP